MGEEITTQRCAMEVVKKKSAIGKKRRLQWRGACRESANYSWKIARADNSSSKKLERETRLPLRPMIFLPAMPVNPKDPCRNPYSNNE